MKYFGYFDAGGLMPSPPVYANVSGTLATTIFISGNQSGTDNVAIYFPHGSSGERLPMGSWPQRMSVCRQNN